MSKKKSAIITFLLGLLLVLVSIKFENNPIPYKILSGGGCVLGLIGGFKLMSLAYKK
ncbi:hypothetical protein OW763_07290 [Clostridium aestuarii]|uniref:Uncharacterized protein n=1 Tax=Clostridium aestuarii TaxID=338193 RepID=A0ABT4CYU4_9CLOT|nr:hypothetical protein [Clostridium aestuarii]MCY6484157.1 hypothetical protein [Clostridium aestuarii]